MTFCINHFPGRSGVHSVRPGSEFHFFAPSVRGSAPRLANHYGEKDFAGAQKLIEAGAKNV
jgi:hypothetical protein